MTDKPKGVIVIGLRDQENEVELVRSRGYKFILFRSFITLEDALTADYPVEIDLNDEEQAIAYAVRLRERFDIHAVYNLNEYRVPLAARMSEALGLTGHISYEAALNCRNKKRTRQQLAEHGVGSARFAVIRTPDDALTALDEIPLPVVVKPSNDAGSNLVRRCDTVEDVLYALADIRKSNSNLIGQVIDSDVLLEEYLEGPEFSVEAVTDQWQTTVIAITAKQITPPPLAVEIGHLVPAPLAEADVAAIHRLVIDALDALGVNSAVTHTEVKLTPSGPRIIEVNARPGGDKIPVLVRAVTGYDLRELSLHLALGGSFADAPRHEVQAPSAAIRFLIADQDGVVAVGSTCAVTSLCGVHSVHLEVDDGAPVERTTNNNTRLGHIIAYGSSEQLATEVADRALEQFELQVNEAL